MATITEKGIQIERLNEIVERLTSHFRKIYGIGINLLPDTPDGQLLGIIAQMKMDFEELAEAVYKQLDPDLATGAWLEQRAAYAGLVRRRAEYSYLRQVILTGEPFTMLYRGLTVSDKNRNRWLLIQDIRLDENGSARADFRSEEYGAFHLDTHHELAIETITLGLSKAVTSENSEVGLEEETDAQLRERFFISRAKNATNSVEAITGKIEELEDVKEVVVLENTTNKIDENGVQPHSINVIVNGGNDIDIANVIFQNKGAGCGLQGNTAVSLFRHEQSRVIKFDRPTSVNIQVLLHITRIKDQVEVDVEAIKTNLANMRFNIGESVHLSRLYSPINQVDGFFVKELKISKQDEELMTDSVNISVREIARIPINQIQIEVS